MDSQFYQRTNEILKRNAANNLIDYKGSGVCKNTKLKICAGPPGSVKRKTLLKKALKQNDTLIKVRSGSKTTRKPRAKKAVAVKKIIAVKKTVAVKKAVAVKVKADKAVKVAKIKAVKADKAVKVAKVKAVKKAPVKRKPGRPKGSGFSGGSSGGCHDCPHCGGAL